MRPGSPLQAFTVVTVVVVISASLVSAAVVLLRPVQMENRMLQQARNVLQLTGDHPGSAALDEVGMLERFRALDARVVDLDTGHFAPGVDPYTLDVRLARDDPERSAAIPPGEDAAQVGRRARHAVVYLVWDERALERVVLPVHGMGMWSTIRGFIALEGDLNTIAAASFFEQAETPGVGDRITRADWLGKWQGRKVYDEDGVPQFAIAAGRVEPGSASALHHVDGLSGATVTADAVTAMVQFWFGPWGYQGLLERLRAEPPVPPARREGGA